MYADVIRALQPRIAIYSQDGFGLGHMRRTSSIAARLLQRHSDACVLTLSDSRLGQFFESSQNHDYLKLPSIVKVGAGEWRAAGLLLPFAEVLAMRQEIIRSAVLSFRPDILLVDHMPHGAMGELLATFEVMRVAMPNTKIVLGLRDILDAPEVVRRRWQAERAYEAIEHYYDLALVYGRREVFDIAEEYGFSPEVVRRLRYCGYVCTPETARYASRIRTEYTRGQNAGSKLIVAMAGGGADAYPMMSAVLDALPSIQALQRCVVVLITGPFMPEELRRHLQARAHGLPVRVRITVSDALSYLDAADLVIAMAGYNTTTEILRSRRRAILIPRVGPSAEQRMRARIFAAKGWVSMLDPDCLTADRLAEMVLDSLRGPKAGPAPAEQPDLGGLDMAVDYLLELLSGLPQDTAEIAGIQQVAAEYPQQVPSQVPS